MIERVGVVPRHRVVARAGLALTAALMAGCGGDGPTRPTSVAQTPAAPTSFTVVSGETQAPIAGARVVVGGVEHVADAQGRVALGAGITPTTLVDILSPEFLDRQTQLSRRGTAGQFTVWPRLSPTALNEHATAELVYTTASVDEVPVIGGAPMRRWAASVRQVSVVYNGAAAHPQYLDFSPAAMATQRAALAEINGALGGRLSYVEAAPGATAAAGQVEVRIFPGYEWCLDPRRFLALATLADGEYQTATITFCSASAAERLSTAAHELGHTMGLRHSSDESDLMFGLSTNRRPSTFTRRETLLMGLMLQRSGGNRFPDNDRSARPSSARTSDTACP